MSNIRFIIDNVVDDSTLTTSVPISTEYPVDNIKRISRSKPMRSLDAVGQVDIKGTLTDTEVVSSLVLAKHNFSDTTTYQLFLYSNDNWSGQIYDSGIIPIPSKYAASDLYEWGEFEWGSIAWGANAKDDDNRQFYDLVLWFTEKSIKSFIIRLDVYGGGGTNPLFCNNSDIYCNYDNAVEDPDIFCNTIYLGVGGGGDTNIAYYEVGRVYLGEYLEPQYNLSPKHNIYWKEHTQQYRPSSGTLQSDETTANRSFEFSLLTIPEADRTSLHKELISVGLRNDFYISIFPEHASEDKEIDYMGSVKFTKVPKYTEFTANYYKSNFIMEEV